MSASSGDSVVSSVTLEINLSDIGTKNWMWQLQEQLKFVELGDAAREAFDPIIGDVAFDKQNKLLEMQKSRLEYLQGEIKLNHKVGESYSRQLQEVDDITASIRAMRANTEEFQRQVPRAAKHMLDSLLIADAIKESIKSTATEAERLGGIISKMGFDRVGSFVQGLQSGIVLMATLSRLTMNYLDQQTKWAKQNNALYGSIQQVNNQVIKASRNSTLLMQEAEEAAGALMEMSIAKDSLVELTGALGDVTREVGLSSVVGARYIKQMQTLGVANKDTTNQFRMLKRAASEWGIAGKQADVIFNKISATALTMHSRLKDNGFRDYQQNLIKIGGAAKVAGADLEGMMGIMGDLEEDRSKYVLLMQGTDWINEKDTTKLFQSMVGNADQALQYISAQPALIQNELAKSMYGVSLETLHQMKKMSEAGGAHLGGLIPKGFGEEWRRLTDPMYGFEMALKDIGQVIQMILMPVIYLITMLGVMAGWFTRLPEPIKIVAGSLIFLALVMTALGVGFSGLFTWAGTAMKALTAFGSSAVAATTGASTGVTSLGGALATFGATVAPVAWAILAVAGAFALLAGGVWILSNSVNSLEKFVSVLVGVGIAIGAFAAIAALSSALLGAAMIPLAPVILVVGATFLLLAGAVWVLSEAFSVFVKSLSQLTQIDLTGLGLQMIAGGGLLIAGMTLIAAAAIIGAIMAPFALVAGLGILALVAPLALLAKVVQMGGIEGLPAFGVRLSLGMLTLIPALILASELMPLSILASISFLALGATLGLFVWAINRDISHAMGFGARLSIAMGALIPALIFAGLLMPLAVLAGATFLVLGATLGLFAWAINRDLSNGIDFSIELIAVMAAMIPALILAAALSPLAVLAGASFLVLGATLGLFAWAIKRDLTSGIDFSLELIAVMLALTPALVLAAALSPLAVLAGVSFLMLGATLGLFAWAINRDINHGIKFGAQLSVAMGALVPALTLAGLLMPLVVLAGVSFLVLGLTLGLFTKAINKDISDAPKFAANFTAAITLLTGGLVLAAGLAAVAVLAAASMLVTAIALTGSFALLKVALSIGSQLRDPAIATGIALSSLASGLALILPVAVLAVQLPSIGAALASGMALLAVGLGLSIALAPLAGLAVGAMWLIAKALGILFGAVAANLVGVASLPIIAQYFSIGMTSLASGMAAIVGSPYIRFAMAANTTSGGLNTLLGAFTLNAAGIALLPMLAQSFFAAIVAIASVGPYLPGLMAVGLGLMGVAASMIGGLTAMVAAMVIGVGLYFLTIPFTHAMESLHRGVSILMASIRPIHGLSKFGKDLKSGVFSIAQAMGLATLMLPTVIFGGFAFYLLGISLDNLLSVFTRNTGGLSALPTLAKFFGSAMQQLRYGMEWLTGAPYIRFSAAASGTAQGLLAILSAIGFNSASIAAMAPFASSIQSMLSETRHGMAWLVGAPYEKFVEAATFMARGISVILQSLGNAADLHKLPELMATLQALADFADNATGGQQMVDLATSTNMAILTLGNGLSDYATYVEGSATRIGNALDTIKAKAAEFAGNAINQIVKNDAVVTVQPNIEHENASEQRHREMTNQLSTMNETLKTLTEALAKGDNEAVQKISEILSEYLPTMAENSDSGLAGKTSNWGTGIG